MSNDHDHIDGSSETMGANDDDTTVLMSEATTMTIITIGDATPEQEEPLPPVYSPPSPVVAATPHGNTIPDPSPPTSSDNDDVLQPPAVAINLIMDTEPISRIPPPPYAKFPRNNGRETTVLIGPPSHDGGHLATPNNLQLRDAEKSSRKKNILVCGMFCAFFLGWGYFALRIAGLI